MLKTLQAGDAPVIARLCSGDMTVILRIGALLQSRLSFTETALQALLEGSGRKLVLDRRLKDADRSVFAILVADHGCGDLGLTLAGETEGTAPGWRVVALEDEIGNPLLAAMAEAAPAADAGLGAMVAGLSPALRVPVEGLMAARADGERAAALEQLRYAMPPLAVVGELMPLILADGADVVRERAIGLLASAGASATVIDLVRALQRRDETAVRRLLPAAGHLPAEQVDLVISAVLAACSRGQANEALVALCAVLAPQLAGHRSLERLIDLLLPERLSLLDLVRALQRHDRSRIDACLARALGGSAAQDAVLVVLLAASEPASAPVLDERALLVRGLELLLSPGSEPSERQALAAALRRLDRSGELAGLLAAAGRSIGDSYETSVHWLIAELCRDGAVGVDEGESLARTLAHLLRAGRGMHLLSVLEQQLPCLLPASAERRAALVEPMLEVVGRFRDERTHDVVVTNLVRLGEAALEPLWRAIEEHPVPAVRILAAELLPEVLPSGEPGRAAACAAAVRRLLAGLPRIEQAEERAARVITAAKVATAPALEGDGGPAAAVDEATAGLGDCAFEALGHLAAGRNCPPGRRAAVIDQLLQTVQCEVPDSPEQRIPDPAGGQDPTWVLDAELARHTDSLPRVLAALGRIGTAPGLESELLERIASRLCRQWRLVAAWRVVWGPGAIESLGRTLADLAAPASFPGGLRVQVCEALVPGVARLSVARGLARVLVHADGPYLATLAGKAVARLLSLAAEDYWADDEQEDLVETLADYLAVPQLGADGPQLRRSLVHLLAVRKNRATSRVRTKLRFLARDLDPDLREKLEWA